MAIPPKAIQERPATKARTRRQTARGRHTPSWKHVKVGVPYRKICSSPSKAVFRGFVRRTVRSRPRARTIEALLELQQDLREIAVEISTGAGLVDQMRIVWPGLTLVGVVDRSLITFPGIGSWAEALLPGKPMESTTVSVSYRALPLVAHEVDRRPMPGQLPFLRAADAGAALVAVVGAGLELRLVLETTSSG